MMIRRKIPMSWLVFALAVVPGCALEAIDGAEPEEKYSPGGPNTAAHIDCDGNGGYQAHYFTSWGCGKQACVENHEQQHINDMYNWGLTVCEGEPAGAPALLSRSDATQTECNAYGVEESCLQQKLAEHQNNEDSDCEAEVEARLQFVSGQVSNYCP